jgi:aryl-alcohol dehydrogenase-like predicted oxidoreductase
MIKARSFHRATRLGASGPDVFPIALGCMSMSGMYGETTDDEGVAAIHAAIEHGITLLDTAGDFYGMGHNELLVRRAIEGRRERVLIESLMPAGSIVGSRYQPAQMAHLDSER